MTQSSETTLITDQDDPEYYSEEQAEARYRAMRARDAATADYYGY